MFQTDMPKIDATFDRAIDGDTISVKVNNRKKTVRLLLVDTPESKKPNTPVQPYAIEAAHRLGMKTVFKDNHYFKAPSETMMDYRIEDLSKLFNIIGEETI